MNTKNIQRGILFIGVAVGLTIAIVIYANPDSLTDVKTLALSIGAYLSVFARQFISEKLSDLLGLDDNSKDIKELQKIDEEMKEKLTETQKRLDDTQDLANELLDKLNAIVDELDCDEIVDINKTLEKKNEQRTNQTDTTES